MNIMKKTSSPPYTYAEIEGEIVRKKKRYDWLVISIKKNDQEPSVDVFMSRNKSPVIDELGRSLRAYSASSEWGDLLYLEAVVCLKGFIRRARLIHAVVDAKRGEEEKNGEFLVDEVTVVRCAPNPVPIRIVLESISRQDGRFPPSILLMPSESDQADQHEHQMSAQEEATRILSLKQRQQRLQIARIVRKLQGQKVLEKDPRYRLPRIKQRDLELLDHMEGIGKSEQSSWKLEHPVQPAKLVDDEQTEQSISLPLNLPKVDNGVNNLRKAAYEIVSNNGSLTRVEYLKTKKHPQIQFMTSRVQALLKNRKERGVTHILDVGGGRGDLATALAITFPKSLITLVDLNESSLQAAREYAGQLGLQDRMYFVHADFSVFAKDPDTFYETSAGSGQQQPPPPINVVVALHACGDLSDLALAFAQRLSCPFVVCPCCYTKRYITNGFYPAWWRHLRNQREVDDVSMKIDSKRVKNATDDRPRTAKELGRLAEIQELHDLRKRSMTIINSMRLHSIPTESYCVVLEEYDGSSSGRNHVLVGSVLADLY